MRKLERARQGGTQALTLESAAQAYRYLSGQDLPDEQMAELLWYERLRRRLVQTRVAARLTQSAVAKAIGVTQSEISRLENTLGAGTQLGTVLAYLKACDSSPQALFGDAPVVAAANDEAVLRIEGEEFRGPEVFGVLECVRALNDLLLRRGVEAAERKDEILALLRQLQHEPSAPSAVTLEIELASALNGEPMSVEAFRRGIATPLQLVGF
jgi:transcriptional regulator with XRE-family HTH domain